MGCDYVIVRELLIEYSELNTKLTKKIELELKKCYFNDELELSHESNYDSDDSIQECFDELYYLNVNHVPRVIYQNKIWRNNNLHKKYNDFVINDFGYNVDITKITKMERRYKSLNG